MNLYPLRAKISFLAINNVNLSQFLSSVLFIITLSLSGKINSILLITLFAKPSYLNENFIVHTKIILYTFFIV